MRVVKQIISCIAVAGIAILLLSKLSLFFKQETLDFVLTSENEDLQENEARYQVQFDSDCRSIKKIRIRIDEAYTGEIPVVKRTKEDAGIEMQMKETGSDVYYEVVLNYKMKANSGDTHSIYICLSKGNSPKSIEGTIWLKTNEWLLYFALWGCFLLTVSYCVLTERGIVRAENPKWIYALYCLAAAFLNYIMVEILYNDRFYGLSVTAFAKELLVHLTIILLLSLILNSVRSAILILSSFWLVVGVLNGFVTDFRSSPIQPQDISSVATAMNVADRYSYTIQLQEVLTLVLFVSCMLLVGWQDRMAWYQKKGTRLFWGIRMSGVVGSLAFFILIFKTPVGNVILPEVNLWNIMTTYRENGFLLSYMAFGTYLDKEEPENYDAEKLREKAQLYEKEDSDTTQNANIIVVMNEAMADFDSIRQVATSENVFQNWDSVTENAIKGNLLVSTKGGGTANTEFEFLTGNSMAGFSGGDVPYVTYTSQIQNSIAKFLKKQGYETIAMHPGTGTNWDRDEVYANMGFDEFYTEDDFADDTERLRGMISDQADYEKMLEVIRSRTDESPYFFLNVTIQNHSDYETNIIPISVTADEIDVLEVNEYLSLLKETDRALGYLIEELKKEEEPTVLVIFGDHYPGISDDSLSLFYQKEIEDLSLDELMNCYKVPFMIWANFEIDEEENVLLSANYLGSYMLEKLNLPMAPWNSYLCNLQNSIVAMNRFGYTTDGSHYQGYGDTEDMPELLTEYLSYQYNQLFDQSEQLENFFD